jgi:hypothetical protein
MAKHPASPPGRHSTAPMKSVPKNPKAQSVKGKKSGGRLK